MKEKWTEEMRRKLEGHRKAPPEGLWEGISEQMGFTSEDAEKEAKGPAFASHPASAKRWYWAAAAAVVVVGGFFALFHHDGTNPSSLTATNVVQAVDTPQVVVAETEPPIAEQPHSEKATPLTEKGTPVTKNETYTAKVKSTAPKTVSKHEVPTAEEPKTPAPPSPNDQNLIADAKTMEQIAEKSEEKTLPSQTDSQQEKTGSTGKQEDGKTPSPSMASMEPARRDFTNPHTHHSPNRDKWTMGLHASGGLLAASSPNGSTNYDPMGAANYEYYSKVFKEESYNLGSFPSSASEEYESKHHLPVRLGISLQYQLNDRLALLSGINYTWLYSEFTKGKSTTDQHLHYIGVPVGVAYRLWSNQHLQCYLSGSVMLEKCLNEKPWQWSVDAGAGAEYAITQQVGLYLEPSLGYYFDDGSSFEHYYKDHPLAPSIMFGLRMHVK